MTFCAEIAAFLFFSALMLVGIASLLFTVDPTIPDRIRRFLRSDKVGFALVAVCVIGLVQYGATKSNVTFTDGIKDAGNTFVTNDTIHIEWVRDTSHMVVPMSAAVYIDYRDCGSTNEWGLLGQSVVSAGSWDGTLTNATNYEYRVWAYYIPPEPVHTNGVWTYKTFRDRAGGHVIPLRARIDINGKAISTPKQKRKDEE